MSVRPDVETLVLLRETVDEVGTNPALQAGGTLFSVTMTLAPTHGWSVVEPPIKDLRHLLDRLRHLDMRSSDIRLERVFPIIDRVGAKANWIGSLAKAKTSYADAQRVTNIRIQHPDEGVVDDPETMATWVTPREAFGLWAYGGVIHSEYAKEQRWARLGPLGQGPVRDMAHAYTMMLIDEAEYMARFLRHGLETELPGGGSDTWPTEPAPSSAS